MSRVSVIIPARNAAPFIRDAVASALDQTHREIEVIVVDDGSADGTADAVAAFGERIVLLRQPGRGAAAARNLGARAATGEWIAFLDADDIWLPAKITTQLAAVDADGSGAALVYSDRFNVGARDGFPDRQSDLQAMYAGDVFDDLLLKGNVITTSSVLVRKRVFDRLGGFAEDPLIPPAEDWDLWIRVAAAHRVVLCREPLVQYRHHPAGASRDVDRMTRARRLVIERALRMPRGRAFAGATRRQIWAQTWATNGWDAARHHRPAAALAAYSRAIGWWPLQPATYRDILKVCLGRH